MFKLLFHISFPKAAIKSRKAEEKLKAMEREKIERGIGHRKQEREV